jgi:hypothetical protein
MIDEAIAELEPLMGSGPRRWSGGRLGQRSP